MLVNTAQATQATQATAPTSNRNNLGTKDIFLKILIAQMQNQDPLKPQDAAQQATQLAQFNMVEQQISTNTLLGDIKSGIQSQSSNMATASSLIGHQAAAQSSQFTFDGIAAQQFNIDTTQGAPTATVDVVNSAGQVVKTLYTGSLAAGTSAVSWNGATNSGATAAPGQYSLNITASDINGQPVASTVQITGLVKAIRLTPNGVFADIGKTPVSMANIAKIY